MDIWCNDELVGTMPITPDISSRRYTMPIIDMNDIDSTAATVSTVEFELDRRTVMISQEEIFQKRVPITSTDMMVAYLGPKHIIHPLGMNIERLQNPERFEKEWRVTWFVGKVDIDTLAALFDLDSFEPADGKPDYETRETDLKAASMDKAV